MREFDLIYVRHNLSGHAERILPQPIAFHELTILLRGNLEYFVNGEPVPLSAGDAVYLPCGSIRARTAPQEPVDYISFNFTTEEEIHLPHLIRHALHSDIQMLIAVCDRIGGRIYPDSNEANRHLFACLLLILEDRVKEESISPLARQIMEYIHANLNRRITLSDIGELTHYSPIYCAKVFKREIGKPILDYVLDRRIDEAKKYLVDDTVSMVQIAEELGFDDYNYFSRIFKKRSGYSPSAYRKFLQNSLTVR